MKYFIALLLLLPLTSHANPLTECQNPKAPEWKAFCNNAELQKIYASAMSSHDRLETTPAGKKVNEETRGWPKTLVESCKGQEPTCARDRVLRYMMKSMPAIEQMQEKQAAPIAKSSPEGSKILKPLVGSYDSKNHHSVQFIEANEGVMFTQAVFYGPYDPDFESSAQCRFVGAANYTGSNTFMLVLKAFSADLCHFKVTVGAKDVTFIPQDESCSDFCGPSAVKKSYVLPLTGKTVINKDVDSWLRGLEEYKKAFTP